MKKVFTFLLLWALAVSSSLFAQSANTNCYCWGPIDSTFQIASMTEGPDKGVAPYYQNNDAATPSVSLPFNFCFYGQNYDSIFICNNGIVTFAYPVYKFITSGGFPLGTDSLILAPFFADAYTLFSTGYVYYKITPTHLIVRWDNVGFETIDQDFYNTFQLIITDGNDPILPAGNNVQFCYIDMQWACSDNSGGFQGFGGLPAIVGVNKGDGTHYAQMATFDVPGWVYYGPFAAFNGLQWLFQKSFVFNTCVTSDIIPPVILNTEFKCDTINACTTDTLPVTATFILAQQAQTCTLAASYSGVSNFSILDTSTINAIDSITVQLITSVADIGTHVLTVTATDNTVPPQTTTHSFVVIIDNCITGVNEPRLNSDFSIYPNPGNGNFTIEINKEIYSDHYEAKIYDVLGKEIYASNLHALKTEVDISSRSKGIYFLKIYNKNSPVLVKKIAIQ